MYKIGDIITYGRSKQKMIIIKYDKTDGWIQFKDKEKDKDYYAFYLEDDDIKKIKTIKKNTLISIFDLGIEL